MRSLQSCSRRREEERRFAQALQRNLHWRRRATSWEVGSDLEVPRQWEAIVLRKLA
jgi:hypothetical protein